MFTLKLIPKLTKVQTRFEVADEMAIRKNHRGKTNAFNVSDYVELSKRRKPRGSGNRCGKFLILGVKSNVNMSHFLRREKMTKTFSIQNVSLLSFIYMFIYLVRVYYIKY